MPRSSSTHDTFWLPLECENGTYIVARDWARAKLNPIPDSQHNSFIHKHCRRIKANVNIGGRVLTTSIFIPLKSNENDEEAYVPVDRTSMPVEESIDIEASRSALDSYFNALRAHLAYSESIFPEQQAYLWTEFLQPRLSFGDGSGGVCKELRDWKEIRNSARVILIGSAGAGKTTLMRRLAIDIADADIEEYSSIIPVYVQLRHWSESKSTEHLVKRELSRIGSHNLTKELDKLAVSGRMIFLLDGLDEVEIENRNLAFDDIRKFMSSFAASRFILSCRPGSYLQTFQSEAQICNVHPWSRSQIKEMCWHKLEAPKKWYSFWSRLEAEPDIFELSSNPLLLSVLMARYIRDNLSPHFTTEIINGAIDTLVDAWDSIRGVKRSLFSKTTPHRKIALLKHLAAYQVASEESSFTSAEFASLIEDINVEDEPFIVLQSLVEETGLIIKHGEDRWKFLHRSVCDWLAAAFMVENAESFTFSQYEAIKKPWWHRAFRYVSGLISNPSRLLAPYLDRGYRDDIAILVADAMSQNLLVERSTVSGFGIYLTTLLKQRLLESQVISYTDESNSLGARILCISLAGANDIAKLNAESACNLIIAAYNVKDGVARHEVKARLLSSRLESMEKLADVFELDGMMECSVMQLPDKVFLNVKVSNSNFVP